MKKINKKGFTIVELVIVIAVIAILSAVLIPTFSSLIKKANISADQQAVKELNNGLIVGSIEGNPKDVKELGTILDESGFNSFESLAPITKGYNFYWIKSSNQIILVEAESGDVEFQIKEPMITNISELEAGDAFNLKRAYGEATIKADGEKSAEELFESALSKGQSVVLDSDITIDSDIKIKKGEDVVINLGEYSIKTTALNENNNLQKRSKAITVEEGATLTIQNGTFEGRSIMNYGNLVIKADTTINAVDYNGGGCIRNKPTGVVTIEGGTFNVPNFTDYDVNNGGAAVVHNDGGKMTIKDGNFSSNTDAYLISSINGGEITIENGTFTAYRGALYSGDNSIITVNNGTFSVTADRHSGWTAIAEGTGKLIINQGEFSHVIASRIKTNNVIDNR